MRKLSLFLAVFLCLSLAGCRAPFAGDERIGGYRGINEASAYSFTLREDGNGVFSFASALGFTEEEPLFFTFDGDVLLLSGDRSGAVLGGGEYSGDVVLTGNGYAVTLTNLSDGIILGTFLQIQ
ncbi:MAG: hypothetical protein MJ078_04130 [Clostridia bacterium]|nr:hypothetical protein [Clostridia bacterium]